MEKFTDFWLGPDQLHTERDSTICDTMAPGAEVSTQGTGRKGCIEAGRAKTCSGKPGVT